MATDVLFLEWEVWSQFLQQTTSGLIMDALEHSHPIQVEVNHTYSVLEIFDAISYKKGYAIIRMLQAYLGDDIFQVAGDVTKIDILKVNHPRVEKWQTKKRGKLKE